MASLLRKALAVLLVVGSATFVVAQSRAPQGGGVFSPIWDYIISGQWDFTTPPTINGDPIVVGGAQQINVKDFGALGDGVTDDSSAIVAAQVALPATGGVMYFPPGSYPLSSSVKIIKDNVTLRGAGMFASTLTRTTGTMIEGVQGTPASNIVIEDLGLDGQGTTTNGIILGRYAIAGPIRISRVRIYRVATSGIVLDNMNDVVIEESLIHAAGNAKGTGISISNSSKNITIRGNRFLWLWSGVVVDTGTTAGQSEDVSEFMVVDGNLFDFGWWLLAQVFSGSGAAVSYSATVLTDTGAAFAGLGANDTVRVMAVLETGTGTLTRAQVVDASALFATAGIRRGHIVRVGTVFGVVMNVVSETELWVEEWLSDTTRLPVDVPTSGTYTVYGISLGKRSSSTATTITVARWYDLDGNTVTPAAETRYEVLPAHPNYPFHSEGSTRKTRVLNNTFRRGWSDQISLYGYESQVIGNTIEDGQDMGITLHGQGNIVTSNTIRHQGAGGIYTTAEYSVIAGNVFSDTPWENAVNTTSLGHIIVTNGVQSGSRNIISNNAMEAGTVATPRHGIVIYNTSGDASDGNLLIGNRGRNHTSADFVVRGAGSTGTKFINNVGVSLADTGATYTRPTTTVNGATTFTIAGGTDTEYVVLACTGAETINTITGGSVGKVLYLENTDTDCTIADDDDATAANAVDLIGTATNDVGAVKKVLTLIHDGTAWLQVSESDN